MMGKGCFVFIVQEQSIVKKSAKRPNNVGQSREVRGQRKPQMCGLAPPREHLDPSQMSVIYLVFPRWS